MVFLLIKLISIFSILKHFDSLPFLPLIYSKKCLTFAISGFRPEIIMSTQKLERRIIEIKFVRLLVPFSSHSQTDFSCMMTWCYFFKWNPLKIYNIDVWVPCAWNFRWREILSNPPRRQWIKAFYYAVARHWNINIFISTCGFDGEKREKIREESPDIRDEEKENGSKIMDLCSKIRFYILVFLRF